AGVVAERFDANAEPRPRNFLPGNQLLTNVVGEIAGNGKAKAAIQSVDQRVHADNLAVNVAERTTGIAGIDRRVGLEVIGNVIAAVTEQFASAFPADDAVGERVIELEWRADGEGELAHSHGVAIAHLHD